MGQGHQETEQLQLQCLIPSRVWAFGLNRKSLLGYNDLILPSPAPHQDVPMYWNGHSLMWYQEDVQVPDLKDIDLTMSRSQDRSPPVVRDVLSEEEELADVQEWDPDSEGMTGGECGIHTSLVAIRECGIIS